MDDSRFKLGNFRGMASDSDRDDDLDDLELESEESTDEPRLDPQKVAEEVERDIETAAEEERESEPHEIIKHPKVPAANAQFRSPLDGQQLIELELDKIVPNEFQPRRIFNQEKLVELAESIKEHGIIQPLVVTPRSNDQYEIVVGERRFRAAKLAGLNTVPVFVAQSISSQTKLELALIENVQRADLNPIEQAKAYERLRDEFGLTVTQIAKRVGKDGSTISNLLRLLRLPAQIQRALVAGEITEGKARPLLSLASSEEMLQMYEIVKKRDMNVRQVEEKIREIKNRKIKVKETFTPDPFLESLENLLRNKFGTRVSVTKKAKGGNITIEFFSDEELNDIVSKLT